jgi:hypothetical protein
MRRGPLVVAVVASIIGLASIAAPPDPVHADDDSGAGPDEHRDEATPTAPPPRPASTVSAADSGQITILRVGGSIDDFVYTKLMTEGTAAEVCPGRIRSGTLRAFYEVVDRFGGQAGTMYACRERWDAINDPDCNGTVVSPVSNPNFESTCWSNHASGRAFDVMVGGSSSSGYNRQRGISIVNWLLATDSQNSPNANARRLGVQQILFADRCWNSEGDRGIASWADMRECGIGHHDHVHVDMNHRGSYAQTSYWGVAPVVLPKPDTQVLWDRNSFWREAVSWWNLGAQNEEGLSLPAGYDRAITGDWDSDGRQDEILLWDRDTGSWFLQNWADGDSLNARMGSWTRGYDEIIAGDWDSGNYMIQSWSGYEHTFRAAGTWAVGYDQVVAGDFDGDGRLDDSLIWNNDSGRWMVRSWQSFKSTFRRNGQWGTNYDELIVGDWSAGGDMDEAIVWDSDSGRWALNSFSNFLPTYRTGGWWSPNFKVAAPGDYDTDGRADDLFLYAPSSGKWVIYSYHRLVPKNRTSGTWLAGFDVINVGSFSD